MRNTKNFHNMILTVYLPYSKKYQGSLGRLEPLDWKQSNCGISVKKLLKMKVKRDCQNLRREKKICFEALLEETWSSITTISANILKWKRSQKTQESLLKVIRTQKVVTRLNLYAKGCWWNSKKFKQKWKEYTEILYRKGMNIQDTLENIHYLQELQRPKVRSILWSLSSQSKKIRNWWHVNRNMANKRNNH